MTDVLKQTDCGLDIYAHILQKFYPKNTFLSLRGKECYPTLNPFNSDRNTLVVSIVEGCARHTDLEGAIPDGDVFDFAELYYKLQGQDLIRALCNELHFSESKAIAEDDGHVCTESDLAVMQRKLSLTKFSFFKSPIRNTKPALNMTLVDVYQMIMGNGFASVTQELRSLKDKTAARKIKADKFSYVTFSGVFKERRDSSLVKHSGLMTIDFDHITNLKELKQILLSDDYFETALMFISPSGDGLKWIVPIDLALGTHKEYFQAIANYLMQTYGIEVDNSGKDVSRACFLPHDPNVYINPIYEDDSCLK